MKKLLSWTITIGIIAGITWLINPNFFDTFGSSRNDQSLIRTAWKNQQSNLVVEAEGRVVLELPDDEDQGHTQRFLVDMENGHRVLILHNLEVAPRVPVSAYSEIRFRGEYDWSRDGGMVHWTHKDLAGKREGGWIEHMGKRYQ